MTTEEERLTKLEEKLDKLLQLITADGVDRFFEAKHSIMENMLDFDSDSLGLSNACMKNNTERWDGWRRKKRNDNNKRCYNASYGRCYSAVCIQRL
jgi:hypothetical protein